MTSTLIYDGMCGICADSVRWVQAHLRPGEDVSYVPYQEIDDLDVLGLTHDDVASAAWWIDPDGAAHGGHAAVTRALQHCNGPWPTLGRTLRIWPVSAAAAGVYRWVAENRHRLSRRGRACPTPVDSDRG